MNIAKVRVDFNRRGRDGVVVAFDRGASSRLAVGDVVVAYQPGEDMEYYATVVARDDERGVSELDVDWASEPGATLSPALANVMWGAATDFFVQPRRVIASGPAFAYGVPENELASVGAA